MKQNKEPRNKPTYLQKKEARIHDGEKSLFSKWCGKTGQPLDVRSLLTGKDPDAGKD